MKRLILALLFFIQLAPLLLASEVRDLKVADLMVKCQLRLKKNQYTPLLSVPTITQQTSLLVKESEAADGMASYYHQIYLESCWLEELDVNLERFCPVVATALDCYLDLLESHLQSYYVTAFFLANAVSLGIEKIHRNKSDESLELQGPSFKREVAIHKLLRAAYVRAWALKSLEKRLPLAQLLPTAPAYPLEEFKAHEVTPKMTLKELEGVAGQLDPAKFAQADRVEASLVSLLDRARFQQWSQEEISKTIQHLDQIEQHLSTVTEGNLEQSYQLIELHRENRADWKLLSQFFLPFRIIFSR